MLLAREFNSEQVTSLKAVLYNLNFFWQLSDFVIAWSAIMRSLNIFDRDLDHDHICKKWSRSRSQKGDSITISITLDHYYNALSVLQ